MDKEKIKNLIAKGRVEKAIDEVILHIKKIKDEDVRNDFILQSSRLKRILREKNLGKETTDNINITVNQITNGVLSMIDKLENEEEKALKSNEILNSSKNQLERILKNEKVKKVILSIIVIFLLIFFKSICFPSLTDFQVRVQDDYGTVQEAIIRYKNQIDTSNNKGVALIRIPKKRESNIWISIEKESLKCKCYIDKRDLVSYSFIFKLSEQIASEINRCQCLPNKKQTE